MTQKKGWKLGQDSFTKMIVWFKDGNVGVVCGINSLIVLDFDDTAYFQQMKHKLSKTISKETGMARFRKKIKEYGPLAGTIEIYDKATGQRIAKFYEGIEKPIDNTEL